MDTINMGGADIPTLDRVIERCQAWVMALPRQKVTIARLAGIGPNTLGRVESPGWNPQTDTIRALEKLIPPDWRPGMPAYIIQPEHEAPDAQ